MPLATFLRELVGASALEKEIEFLKGQLVIAQERERDAVNKYLNLDLKPPVQSATASVEQTAQRAAFVDKAFSLFRDQKTGLDE